MNDPFVMKNPNSPRIDVRVRGKIATWMLSLISLFSGDHLVLSAPTVPRAASIPSPVGEWEPVKETVVVFNPSCEGSEALAKYYAGLRHIPDERVVGIACPKEETITRDEFEKTIREPLLKKFTDKKWWVVESRDVLDPNGNPTIKEPKVVSQDVRVLVLMRGMPLRVKRASQEASPNVMETDEASVDSELAALGLMQRPIKGGIENRYYQSTRRFADHYEARGQLLVGRLDAADIETVKRMINDTLKAESEGLWGRAVVDFALKDGAFLEGERWLGNSVKLFRDAGIPVYADRNKEILRNHWPLPDTILYFGWYIDQCSGALGAAEFKFKPGAIACHLHSFSAASLRTKTEHWCGPLLDHGAAAVLGNVWEPYLTLTTHFDLVNARLLEGFTLGEAAWSGTPVISWMNVLVGDPLYRPFRKERAQPGSGSPGATYALYHDLAHRYLPHDGKKFRREIVHIAEENKNPALLELAAMLSTLEGNFGEADDFYQHARSLNTEPADQIRCALYRAELAQRKGKPEEARDQLEQIINEPSFAKLAGYAVAQSMKMSLPQKP